MNLSHWWRQGRPAARTRLLVGVIASAAGVNPAAVAPTLRGVPSAASACGPRRPAAALPGMACNEARSRPRQRLIPWPVIRAPIAGTPPSPAGSPVVTTGCAHDATARSGVDKSALPIPARQRFPITPTIAEPRRGPPPSQHRTVRNVRATEGLGQKHHLSVTDHQMACALCVTQLPEFEACYAAPQPAWSMSRKGGTVLGELRASRRRSPSARCRSRLTLSGSGDGWPTIGLCLIYSFDRGCSLVLPLSRSFSFDCSRH